ncbi:leucine rich repeat protein, bspa family protein [Entamoeba histolytica HM-3:IMSS]|uniref:Leucine rich repeat protein, bspa family protein n=1 Tax=Entamoeba histolytica HM-3:IMSS TaxID=885315 RepID=M7VXB0_ENTHI|nr:leucine rich repeat protein, bspa family protein [Entamoeba histolytica HM-3:IMSS]
MNGVDRHSMLIIGKYFQTRNDYVNVMSVCKKYHDIVDLYHFNPFPLLSQNDRAMFISLETQHIYSSNDIIYEDVLQYVIHCEVSYDTFIGKEPNTQYLQVKFTKNDMKSYGYEIPRDFEVKGIGKDCFKSSLIRLMTIPNNIHYIEEQAFFCCRYLTSITLSTSIKILSKRCFAECNSLQRIKMNHHLERIEDECFLNCLSLSHMKIPSTLSYIGYHSFCNCKSLNSLKFTNANLILGISSLEGCEELTQVILPTSLTVLPKGCFSQCHLLQEINVNSIQKYGPGCFYGCFSLPPRLDLPPISLRKIL